MKIVSIIFLFSLGVFPAAAQFAPPAGQPGSSAMHKDSSAFKGWATGCTVVRGLRDVANPDSGYADLGDITMALGKAFTNPTVSLGDGGSAVLTFASPIINGTSWDFAIFENSFSDDFLELAFVEVSSDGVNYFRFPATSLTQDTTQLASFGSTDAMKVNNLAGKYRAQFGTPFDLEELKNETGLDVNHITHVKIIDVVGSIDDQYATYDQHGNKINDPWPTPFPSSGFDLDAVGVINQLHTGFREPTMKTVELEVHPNPVQRQQVITVHVNLSNATVIVFDSWGKEVVRYTSEEGRVEQTFTFPGQVSSGTYFVRVNGTEGIATKQIIILD